MSKLSFRARALDASKPMPVYKSEEIPDLPDFAAINRAVPQMPTGMEKEEETEHHLQRALSAQQVYGSATLVIPVPEIDTIGHYEKMYRNNRDDYKPPKQYVHVQAWGMDQEIPDYDMDSEDEQWMNKQARKMEITPLQFENMMDRLEKGSGQQVVTLQEAKLLLKEDDDLIISVYDYWLNKRLRTQHALIHAVKTEKRDGSTTNNPYVAFRRRTEKMQTRKNRKNDEASYEKMLKLRRDLNKALTILELMKRREKSKKEFVQLTIEIVEKRYQMGDWAGSMLSEALAQRHKIPSFLPVNQYAVGKDWTGREEVGFVRKKREYKKRKHKQQAAAHPKHEPATQLPQYDVDVLHPDVYSSDEEPLSPALSPSDHEDENDPDGIYAFKRKKGCNYHAPIMDGLGNWPWYGREEGGFAEKKFRYSLTSLSQPRRCIGFARRRMGRGGRVLLDRGWSEYDDHLGDLDMTSTSGPSEPSGFVSHIKSNNYLHFRPRTPTEDESPSFSSPSPLTVHSTLEFNIESFQNHQEQLLQMQRQQQEQLLKQETTDLDSSIDLEHSFSSQPTSRFTLDSATAQFAASAVLNSSECQTLIQQSTSPTTLVAPSTTATNTITTPVTIPNGPVAENKGSGFSTSPAATVLQLNYPISAAAIGKELSSIGSSSSSVVSSSTSSISTGLLSTTAPTTPVSVLATKAVTPTLPTVLKLGQTANTDSLPKENHEDHSTVNNVVKENVVAMEVT